MSCAKQDNKTSLDTQTLFKNYLRARANIWAKIRANIWAKREKCKSINVRPRVEIEPKYKIFKLQIPKSDQSRIKR